MRRAVLALVAVGVALSEAACTQVRNPATGELQYTSLTPADERTLGQQEHPKALRQFGGAYKDKALQAYVTRTGNRVKAASELGAEPFTFTLLDSDVVNAFALPGGYVYVTRGLVALTNNEAELAGVLGHEIGHVTARHSAQRYDQAQLGQYATLAGQLAGMLLGGYVGGAEGARLGGQGLGQATSLGAQAIVQGYSRDQEFEADQLGIRYLGAAGYEPGAMATFLATLQADDAYRQRTKDGGTDEASFLGDWFRSHPRTPERVARAVEATSAEMPGAHTVDREALLDALDGMLWGEDPAQGVIRGTSFTHPGLKIAFQAPPGFRLQNSPSRVAGGTGRGGCCCSTWPTVSPATCAATCSRAGSRTSGCRSCKPSSCRSAPPPSASARSRSAAARRRRCSPWSVARATRSTASSSLTAVASAATTLPRRREPAELPPSLGE